MKRRWAISLVELLLTLSACTVILTLSAGLIHRIMHVQSKARAVIVPGAQSATGQPVSPRRASGHQCRNRRLARRGVFLVSFGR
jgi:hypothetical protein